MTNHLYLLQAQLNFKDFKLALLCYVTAFVITLIFIPPVISFVKRFKLFDRPGARKEHQEPTPTFGGLAIFAGMMISLLLWFSFTGHMAVITFFFSMLVLLGMGIMDDLKDLSASYKLVVEIALATLITISGIRITGFGGLFGIHELSISAQYTFTVLAIVGITNAFNLIDGIDGLAGGLGFMSLITLGIFLTLSRDYNYALIAFALAGALLAFLYFNLNPARIFMGDTGSLLLGFVVAVLCVQLIKINSITATPIVPKIHMFTLGIVLIPVFDTLRVFGVRIWKGRSPFSADKTHIHHFVINEGFGHAFTARLICVIHGFILLMVFWMKNLTPVFQLVIMLCMMILFTFLLRNIGVLKRFVKHKTGYDMVR